MTEVYISLVDLSMFRTKCERSFAIDDSWKTLLSCLLPMERIEISKSENGKPYLLSPPGWYYNLSHSRDLGVSVLTEVPVGVDIEFHNRKRDVFEISNEYFHYNEIKRCLHDPNLFFDIWTRKESWIKLRGLSVWHMKETPDMSGSSDRFSTWTFLFRGKSFSLSVALDSSVSTDEVKFIWHCPDGLHQSDFYKD